MLLLSGSLLAIGAVGAMLLRESLDQEREIRATAALPAPSFLVSRSPSSAEDARTGDSSVIPSSTEASSARISHPVNGSSLEVRGTDSPSLAKDHGAIASQEESAQEPPPEPLPTPAVYADPEKLGEVTEHDESMYARTLSQFAERMSNVTAPPDSAEYREQFRRASEEAENTMRALMGNDAFLKMQAASERGETVK